jgi:poly-gamma-glutamate capsule biosynthesis protein CapA/YwtB (metallophosphatase superfamily)
MANRILARSAVLSILVLFAPPGAAWRPAALSTVMVTAAVAASSGPVSTDSKMARPARARDTSTTARVPVLRGTTESGPAGDEKAAPALPRPAAAGALRRGAAAPAAGASGPAASRQALPAGRHQMAGPTGAAGTAPIGAAAPGVAAAEARTSAAPAPTGFTMALTGDSIITRRLSVYDEPAFRRLVEIVRGADAAFTNLEMLFHDYEPYPMNESGGTYMRAEPALVKELVWAGFDLVSRANNHTGDYGADGMRLTTKYVDAAGLVQAGVGENLAEAREAKYLETGRGRVALVSVASTFPDHSRAGRARGGVRGRPGLNPLRFTTTYVVTRPRFEALKATMKELGLRVPDSDTRLQLFGQRFEVGDAPGVRTEPLKEDLDEIAAVVRGASRLADYTLVTFHGHEGRPGDRFVPADFLVTFSRAMIDAGASVVAGHGPHVLRGIEIYKGKPIFYSLGDFIFQNETVLRLPDENYAPYGLGPEAQVADFNASRYDNDRRGFPADREIWEAVVAVTRWSGGSLAGIDLHPITLGFGRPPAERGRPQLAEGELARKIIDDLTRLSKPFGTQVVFDGGIGRVVLPAPTSSQER